MEKFINDMGNIYWWVSVVFVGLILNVIAGFGFKYLDSILTRLSVRRRAEKGRKDIEDNKRIEFLSTNDTERIIQSNYILYLRIQVIISLLFTVLYGVVILLFFNSAAAREITKSTFKVIVGPLAIIQLWTLFRAWKFLRQSSRENVILWKARVNVKAVKP